MRWMAVWRGMRAVVLALAVLAVPEAGGAAFYHEAPELAGQPVPPVEERLPRNPLLLPVTDRIGTYGGEWRLALFGYADGLLIYRSIGYEPLIRWDPSWRRLVPNVAQAYEVNATATEFVFHIRPGLRWSDGEKFTADDVRFWFDDVLMVPDLIDDPPNWLPADRSGIHLMVDDPLTIRFVFDRPNSLFLASLAAGQANGGPTNFPRHYLERFHQRYNPNADAEAKAEGFPDWQTRFLVMSGQEVGRSDPVAMLHKANPALDRVEPANVLPTLYAWNVVRREPGNPSRYVAVRNPYYFKIDPAGNQLPYIDRVVLLEVSSLDEIKALMRSGTIGMQARHVANLTRQADGAELIRAGDYRPITLLPATNNVMPLAFNQTHPDPAKRAILGNREVRIGLSLAIDRKTLIDNILFGFGEPSQPAPRPESRYYSAHLANQYITYSPVEANAHLDRSGFTERGPDGIRYNKDGIRLSFTVYIRKDRAHQAEMMKVITENWRAVGVEVKTKALSRKDLKAALEANDFDVQPASSDGGLDPLSDVHAYMPIRAESTFAPLWQLWAVDPKDPQAEVPPEPVQHQLRLYRDILSTPSPEVQARDIAEILDIAADEFYVLGISTEWPGVAIASKSFANVPRVIPDSWLYPTPAPTDPSQYFIVPDASGN